MTQSYVNKEEIISLAKNAALELDDAHVEELVASMNDVVALMQEVIAMDITHIILEATVHHFVGPEDLREDMVTSDFTREEFLVNVPMSLGGLVKVPTVIK
ncbi:Asp-tRNA(Asn)/Glu-tRNA(Gln) amidotransferase subunit GatC [Chlamydia sp.]|uniref:Asp-tRNA(Asn)/Glu-tRNA(Gln) amidotransferase subunit GatC n=1 Tax=Chlamydia sp. TaxID=35827 RepID=UPI0025BF252A|nr:Asp-tRNA(Asn)/Glu-tRNA(Gln) amidotransferase subunit GatC [Chlamydia sp.]MBQ8498474.1 Asp-tRNA(Asn)/Glu-tRNA(Gln) amidotransferase subunit GatC [Chlamydia sp.]